MVPPLRRNANTKIGLARVVEYTCVCKLSLSRHSIRHSTARARTSPARPRLFPSSACPSLSRGDEEGSCRARKGGLHNMGSALLGLVQGVFSSDHVGSLDPGQFTSLALTHVQCEFTCPSFPFLQSASPHWINRLRLLLPSPTVFANCQRL